MSKRDLRLAAIKRLCSRMSTLLNNGIVKTKIGETDQSVEAHRVPKDYVGLREGRWGVGQRLWIMIMRGGGCLIS